MNRICQCSSCRELGSLTCLLTPNYDGNMGTQFLSPCQDNIASGTCYVIQPPCRSSVLPANYQIVSIEKLYYGTNVSRLGGEACRSEAPDAVDLDSSRLSRKTKARSLRHVWYGLSGPEADHCREVCMPDCALRCKAEWFKSTMHDIFQLG